MAVKDSKVLIITQNWGIEETELTRPLRDLREAGAQVTLAAAEKAPVETVQHDRYAGETVDADAAYGDVNSADYDLLVVPGGTTNVDRLRVSGDAQRLAKEFAAAGKPIAAICHGAWLLVNAGLLPGKTLTSTRYIKADVENAGGTQVDQEVKVCNANGWRLITSRKPADLDAFVGAIKDTLEE
ncbi:MAG: type 1 glutamine amidotransferase [Bifidobacteriaceae bacterium]|jgi:protease I|nr:type 1 glutamine amidotransferase [Bifidobacteriaceae bacterium]